MTKRKDGDIIKTLVKKQKLADKMWPDEMTPDAARKIEKLQEKWRHDSERTQREQAEERNQRKHPLLQVKEKNIMDNLPRRDNTPLTVEQAKRVDKIQQRLVSESRSNRSVEIEEKRELEKKQEPIVKAIQEQTETIKTTNKPKRVQLVRKPSTEQFRPRASSTPGRSNVDVQLREATLPDVDETDVFTADTLPPTPAPTIEPDDVQNRSIREFTQGENIGYIAKKYLSTGNDRVFGIYYDFNNSQLAIGSQPITIENDDIILDATMDRYVGTDGLWKLLTQGEIGGVSYMPAVGGIAKTKLINIGEFTSQDFENYKDILIKTHALYQNNDPNSRRPKSSGSWKWVNLVGDVWRGLKQNPTSGKGLLVDTNSAVEYKYIDDMGKLNDRIKFIQAEEEAGNNNFDNEKLAIVKFINDRMEKLITKPEGTKYINRCLTGLSEKDIAGGTLKNEFRRTNFGLVSDRKKYIQLFGRK